MREQIKIKIGETGNDFSDPLGKKKERDRPALRAKRRRGVSDNHVSQMSASQQTGSDESERWGTRNALPVLWHACEI